MNGQLLILVRCGSGSTVGLGHVVRMITLAKALEEKYDAEVRFLCDHDPVAERKIEQAGLSFSVNRNDLAEDAFIGQAVGHADVLVLDKKYPYSADFICQVRNQAGVVVVDHTCDGMFDANLTVFPAADLSPEVIEDPRWRSAQGQLLHGPEFVIVSREILALPQKSIWGNGSSREDEQGHVVVTTGGSDPRGVLITISPWLGRLPLDREVRILVGEGFPWRDDLARLKERLPRHVRVLPFGPEHFRGAFLAVCTFGVTTYELMFLGIPTLVIGHSPENTRASQILTERFGATVDLGPIDQLTEERFAAEVMSLVRDRGRLAAMAEQGCQVIDGKGAQRIADQVMALVERMA